MGLSWCRVCCTRHARTEKCPGDVPATGPERHGFRVIVETPHSMDAYGVLVAPAGDEWRARILTFPKSLWTIPGGGGSMKFVAATPQDAERQAIRFIEEHCRQRGYLLRNELEPVHVGRVEPEKAAASRTKTKGRAETAPLRKLYSLPVKFGQRTLSFDGFTRDLSEGGIFVVTSSPLDPLVGILLRLEFPTGSLPLRGTVIWSRVKAEPGRPPGMGVRLSRPPAMYVSYIHSLP